MKPYPGTQTLQRTMTLLDLFSDERPSWGVAALAQAAALNRTTVYRLLSVLEAAEWVVRDPETDEFRLGSGLIALGARAGRANRVRTVARPWLEQLAAATGETITLETLSEGDMVIVDELGGGDRFLGSAPHVGTRWPVHATSTGKALLAFLPEATAAAHLEQAAWTAITDKTMTDPAVWPRERQRILDAGYAVVRDELELGYSAVGAPIFAADGRPIAAVSIGGATARLTPDRLPALARQLMQTTRQISHQLGYRSDS